MAVPVQVPMQPPTQLDPQLTWQLIMAQPLPQATAH